MKPPATATASTKRQLADAFLDRAWRHLRNDAGAPALAPVHGAIAMAQELGALNAEQAELWCRRLETCPGHDDEGGRRWCAYCGDLPTTETEP
jgi:hypothetical protein